MKIGNLIIEVVIGDITKAQSDAIVNAANPSLMGGGGVDGAIHRKGGPQILEECKAIVKKNGRCKVGAAVITNGGELPARYIIHTVGPVWHGGNGKENELLRKAYFSSLKLAEEHNITSLAFPNISTGIYGYPKDKAAAEVKAVIDDYFERNSSIISKVTFVCFDEENYNLYNQIFQ